jgi:large conductance mechanosensitive channel
MTCAAVGPTTNQKWPNCQPSTVNKQLAAWQLEVHMSFVKEFREFAVKGNVVDMAVGIIIGAAFGKIVSSFVGDVVTPPLGYLIGGVDFTKLAIALPAFQEGKEAVTVRYGAFLQTVFDFVIVAFAIFLAVKAINRLKRKEEIAPSAPPLPSRQEVLLEEIRDLLKQR